MGRADIPYLAALERWSPKLFLIAGGVLAVYATANGLWAFTDMVTEQNALEIGYVLGFLGLLGIYPSLASRSPRLARAGAVAAGCGIIGILFVSLNDLVQLTGIISDNLPGWSFFRLLPLIGFIVGYLSFGLASLRSAVYSHAVSVFLLLPGLIVVIMLVHIAAGYASDLSAFVISAGEAMAHLAIGASLQSASEGDPRNTSASEADSASASPDEVESSTDD